MEGESRATGGFVRAYMREYCCLGHAVRCVPLYLFLSFFLQKSVGSSSWRGCDKDAADGRPADRDVQAVDVLTRGMADVEETVRVVDHSQSVIAE